MPIHTEAALGPAAQQGADTKKAYIIYDVGGLQAYIQRFFDPGRRVLAVVVRVGRMERVGSLREVPSCR